MPRRFFFQGGCLYLITSSYKPMVPELKEKISLISKVVYVVEIRCFYRYWLSERLLRYENRRALL